MISLDVNIRNAQSEDIPGISAVYEPIVLLGTGTFEITPPSKEELARRMAKIADFKAPYLVAELEDQILGFAFGAPLSMHEAYRFTVADYVFVHPECQKLGIGTQLLNSLITECDLRGFHKMAALIGGRENKAALALHSKCRFTEAGLLKEAGFKFNRWIDLIIMERGLCAPAAAPSEAHA